MTAAPKLLSINAYHYRRGGAEAVYFDHDAMFAQSGWRTAFFAMKHPENKPDAFERFFTEEIELGHDYSLLERISKAGKVIYSVEARRKLASLLDAFPADIAHAHQIYHHLSPSILPLLKARGVTTVLTAHDLKLACPAYTMRSRGEVCERCKGGRVWNVAVRGCVADSRLISGLVFTETVIHRLVGLYRRHLDRIVTPSRFYRDKLIEWGWAPDRLTHIPNFVDVAAIPHTREKDDYVLYFGRLSSEKGIGTLIRAAASARVPLKIAGSGPDRAELEALAGEVGAQADFLGRVTGDALWRLVGRARAAVLPSEWYENAPISVLEASAAGTPVVGADIGGIPELIVDGVTGRLFPSRSAEALAGVLADIAGAPDDQLADMGAAGRARVEAEFSRGRYLDRMREVYGELRPDLAVAGPVAAQTR